jgi:hypothetical protein
MFGFSQARENCMKYQWSRFSIATVAICIAFFSSTWFAVQLQERDDAAIAQQFVGMWRLVSYTHRMADGTTRQDPKNTAYIVYTDKNRMCYVAMDPNRPKWKSENTPTPEEAISGIMGLGAYCATVEVHAKEGFVLHHVEVERVPNLVGRNRKRWFKFEGPNRLTLRIDTSEVVAPDVERTLVWERVQY